MRLIFVILTVFSAVTALDYAHRAYNEEAFVIGLCLLVLAVIFAFISGSVFQ